MIIDIYTFALVLGITYFIQFVIFLFEYHLHPNYNGPGWWLLWSSAAFMGFVFMVLRQISSIEHVSILMQNLMHFSSACFLYIGIMRFWGLRERLKLLIFVLTIFIIPFSYFLFIEENIQIRTIWLWSSVSVLAGITAYDLYINRKKTINLATDICILVFIAHLIFAASKVIMLLTGSEILNLNSQVLINTTSYVEILIVSLFWTYGIIMMINQRLTSEMERAKDHFEIIYNTTPDAMLIVDLDNGLIKSVNDKFQEIAGYSPSMVIGKTTFELNFWKFPDERSKILNIICEQGFCSDYATQFIRGDQEIRTGMLSSRIINLNNKPHLISIIRDITDRKKREEEIINQNNQLQILNSEKDKFFSIIAHDLKSPFSSFLGLTEVMAEEIPKLPIGEVIQLASKMRDSARNLYGLLENLLEWSLIKQGVTGYSPQNIPIFPNIEESLRTYEAALQNKSIKIVIQVAKDEKVYADQNMLRSLIRNLLSNAIKFTSDGGVITISARKISDLICQISVKDTGIGISKDMLGNLFKIDTTTSRKGTNGELSCGLGLLLCKEFVSRHNGEIWVESEEGSGSTFYVELPFKEE